MIKMRGGKKFEIENNKKVFYVSSYLSCYGGLWRQQ